jgi:spermidine/putrescine transport system ATP-binding protein
MPNDLAFAAVEKRFGDFTAVRDLNLTIGEGEFFSFLGPSGCGKTTILRMVSGFIEPSAGEIRLGGRNLAGIGPNKRPTALIFQNLALFPLMTVAENIGFGLDVRGVARAERDGVVRRMLDLIALPGLAERRIDELSGGQKQRVAIARALAVEPQVLLLDEPLSALDLKLRQHMRAELRAIQKRTGVTFIYITHDQGEALAMSDRVAVMSAGRMEQCGPSADIYDRPLTAFVASFVGENNAIPGRIAEARGEEAAVETRLGRFTGRNPLKLPAGAEAILFVRPEKLKLGAGAGNAFESAVTGRVFEGAAVDLHLDQPGGRPIMVRLANDEGLALPADGARVAVGFAPAAATVLPPGELARD